MSEKLVEALRTEAQAWDSGSRDRTNENNAPLTQGEIMRLVAVAFRSLADGLDHRNDEPRQEPGGVESNAPGTTF